MCAGGGCSRGLLTLGAHRPKATLSTMSGVVRPLLSRQTASRTALERGLTWLAHGSLEVLQHVALALSRLVPSYGHHGRLRCAPARQGTQSRNHRVPRWTCWDLCPKVDPRHGPMADSGSLDVLTLPPSPRMVKGRLNSYQLILQGRAASCL